MYFKSTQVLRVLGLATAVVAVARPAYAAPVTAAEMEAPALVQVDCAAAEHASLIAR